MIRHDLYLAQLPAVSRARFSENLLARNLNRVDENFVAKFCTPDDVIAEFIDLMRITFHFHIYYDSIETVNSMAVRTMSLPIDVEDGSLLNSTIDTYNRAWGQVVQWCLLNKTVNKTRVQKAMYHELRAAQPQMLSQFASIALREGAAAVKSWNSNHPRKLWQLRATRRSRSVPLDLRLFSLRGNLLTYSTSVKSPRAKAIVPDIPQWFADAYPDAKVNAVRIHISPKGNVQAKLIFRVPIPESTTQGAQVVGIDRGLYKIAVTSKGGEFSGATARAARRRFQHNRKTLQSKGTRSAKRRLKAMKGREERFTRDVNHVISKQLASDAEVATYILEDLTGIARSTKGRVNRTTRKWLGQWAFAQLEFFLVYKCQMRGIEVDLVDPRNTSKMCNACKNISTTARKKGRYSCKKCGHKENADVNASRNIRDKYLLSIPVDGAGRDQPPMMDGTPDAR